MGPGWTARIEKQEPLVQMTVAGSPHQVKANGSTSSTSQDDKKMPTEM
jgi:hypothetical protein